MQNGEENSTVIVHRGSLLRSTITFSDLSGGYDTVRSEYDVPPPPPETTSRDAPTSSTMAGGFTSVPLRTYEIIDDPNSMAVFAVAPSNFAFARGGTYEATIMISHRKLRTLFKNAVDWYLEAKGIDPTQPRFYRLAQVNQGGRVRTNVQWRYMTFHLPDDLDTQAPLTRMLDRVDHSYVSWRRALIARKLLYTVITCFILFIIVFRVVA